MLEEYFLYLSSRQEQWVTMFTLQGALNGRTMTASPSLTASPGISRSDKCSCFNTNHLKHFGFANSQTDCTDAHLILLTCNTDS